MSNQEIINTSAVELDTEKTDLPAVVTDNEQYKLKLREDPTVRALTNELDVQDTQSILAFGQKPSEGISRISDELLRQMSGIKTDEISAMLNKLTKVIEKFDIEEVDPDKQDQNVFKKFLGKGKNKFDKIFAKYDNMGKSVDEIHKLLVNYQNDIYKSNENLKAQLQANTEFFQELEKYVVAGEIGIEEIERFEDGLKSNPNISEGERDMQIAKLEMMKEMLSQRVYDLRIAEQVALQTCPMINTMQMSNFNLLRKINSSFIITLPIFKQCIVSAMQLKKQSIQAKSLQQLDDTTNMLLERNAKNTAQQSVNIARLAGGSSIKIETLQNTYETIKNGIEETKQITQTLAAERQANTNKLESMKDDIKALPAVGTPD